MARQANRPHSTKCDPLVWAAREINRLNGRLQELDRKPAGISTEQIYREGEIEDLKDRIAILRDFISVVPARSLGGLLVQLDQLHVITDLNMESENDADRITADRLRSWRIVHSMRDYMRNLLPPGLAEEIESPNAHLNPWQPYEGRVAQVAARAA